MKKMLLGVLLLGSSLFAEVTNVTVTSDFINSTKLKIIDIRTQGEWRDTGIIKKSYPLTFFNEKGNYDIDGFLNSLNKIVKKDEKFALICRTGSRTGMVSNFLGNKLNYHVVNLKGGMMKLMREGYKPVPYKSKK
ncbi:MAG: rhodanese-like domain-containing protein [Sulfurovaceae bacterium]|nr:rhodanese-like domain-containing protein [Sulfurovaceae bacterium]